MVKLNNKGFSLVEVIIAAAIFAILVYPITTALISASNTGTKSRKKQYAVETAEEVLEAFKTADLDASTIELPADDSSVYKFNYVPSDSEVAKKTSTRTVTIVGYENGVNDDDGTYNYTSDDSMKDDDDQNITVTATTSVYSSDDVAIGTSYEKYACDVEVDDAAYQVFKKGYVLVGYADTAKTQAVVKVNEKGNGPAETNVSSSGVIRNLNGDTAAIIVTATYNSIAENNNLDNLAYQNFLDQKKSLIRRSEYSAIAAQLDKGVDIFGEDMFEKTTTIKITKTGEESNLKYTVTCSVVYKDNTKLAAIKSEYENEDSGDNIYEPELGYDTPGVVYEQTFSGELPPIYLIYVPALCNGKYCDSDNIVIDNEGIKNDDLKANVYVLETAADLNKSSATYQSIIASQLSTEKKVTGRANDNQIQSIDELIYTNASRRVNMKDVKVNLMKTEYSDADAEKVKVYSNFELANAEYVYTTIDNDDSGDVYLYDLTVNVTADSGNGTKTTVTGTRGK